MIIGVGNLPRPIINWDKVRDSGILDVALDVCPSGVFSKNNGKLAVKDPDACTGCRACEASLNGEIIVED